MDTGRRSNASRSVAGLAQQRSLAARPDARVVATGTTHDRALAGPWYLGTRGGSRASLLAAARVLSGSH